MQHIQKSYATNVKNVYSAGDIAEYPYFLTNERINSQHYADAVTQGSFSAMNMLEKNIKLISFN